MGGIKLLNRLNDVKKMICGVDEVGRGPLAGAVVTAAVILDPNKPILGLADSKKLSAKKREKLSAEIIEKAIAYSFGRAEVAEIDKINILQATLVAMQRAVCGLKIVPDHALIDGNKIPQDLPCSAEAIIGGDGLEDCISAASIIAKVHRDQEMQDLALVYPQYGFEKHKGYGTKQHLQALQQFGATPIHRHSFKPVQHVLND